MLSRSPRLTTQEYSANSQAGSSNQLKPTPSTPADPSLAFMAGIEQALALAKLPPEALGHVFHGTTVATNLILESKGAKAALLTTAGFKHVLEIGRHDIPRKANMYSWVKPKRPVPPERIHEVAGRLDPDLLDFLSQLIQVPACG